MKFRSLLLPLVLAGALFCTPAFAGPIPGAILYAAGTIAAEFAFAGPFVQTVVFFTVEAALYLAATVGLTYVSQAVAGKPKGTQTGVQGSLQFGDTRPRSFGVGKFCTAGSLIYVNTWTYPGQSNKPNEFMTLVIALSDSRLTGLLRVFVGDSPGTYSTSGHTTPLIPGWSIPEFEWASDYYLWLKFYDGTQTTADPTLIDRFGADQNYPWTASMVGEGMAYVIVTARFNTGVFAGFPQLRFECLGMPLYDPRQDALISGSGSQSYDDPSSWTYSDNNAVVIYNILRGISGPGGQWMYGLQNMNATRCPIDNWIAGMNACDVGVDDLNGGTEKSFRCGMEIMTSVTPADVIDELAKCCHARIAEIGGVYKISVGAAQVPALNFDDSAFLINQPQSLAPFPSLDSTVNAITAKYPEPAEAWNLKDAPSLFNAALETEDGGRRLPAAVQYDAAPYPSQVQRLMASAVQEARKFRKHSIVLPPLFWILEPTDTVAWTSKKNGYISKLFRIEAMDDNDNLDVGIQMTECDPGDYDFDPDTDYTQPVGVVVLPPFPPVYVPPSDLNVLLEAKAFLRNVQRLLDQYAEIAITHSYKQEWVLPGLTAGVSARVDQEITLRADADAALAELVFQATAIAGAATANALIRWVAAAGPEGVVSRIALESRATLGDAWTQAGLYIDAMIIDGVLQSQITLKADTIWLDADAGRVLLSNGGVTTQLLAQGAATGFSSVVGADHISIVNDGAWHDLAVLTRDFEGNPAIIEPSVLGRNDDNTTHGCYIRLVRDDVGRLWPISADTDGAFQFRQSDGQTISFAIEDTPPAGSHTYRLQYKGAGSPNLKLLSPILQGTEIKR